MPKKGQPLSEEMRARLSEANKKRWAERKAVQQFAEVPVGAAEASEVAPAMDFGEQFAPAEAVGLNPEPLPDTPFGRFLSTVDAETLELLSEDELLEIFNQQMAAAKAAKRAERKKAVAQLASHHAKVEEGILPQAAIERVAWQKRMNENVTWTCRLPFDGAGKGSGPPCLYVDQMRYVHGETYTTSRAIYESVAWMMYAAHQHQAQFEGKSQTWYGRQQENGVYGGFGAHQNARLH